MNRSTTVRRKVVYLAILIVMLIPLYLLGQPTGGGGDGGGQLAQMRDEFEIAESDLGEISPASETMKLASLGLRGVAASLLWNKSHEFRVTHEWDRLKATLNNIALLQPHFDRVWEFQAHNLAYNVSTEFDDYRQRYEMVREGTEFLTKGVKQNRKAPKLIWYTGWFYGQKMGMSDERRQFRRLFSDDEALHESLLDEGIAVDSPEARGPLGKPDNWLVGRLWLENGYELVDSGIKIRRQTPLNFYETGPKWRIKHAEAIEKEGVLDQRAQSAWRNALADWNKFGNRPVPTTATFTIKLDQLDELIRKREGLKERFREVAGDVYLDIENNLISRLQPNQIEAVRTPVDQRSSEQMEIAEGAQQYLLMNFTDIARKVENENRLEAIQIAGEIEDVLERIIKTSGYRKQINYTYWKTLAEAEQEERTVLARRYVYEAEQANEDAELDTAIDLYEKAFEVWAEIFDDYPILVIDDSAQDLFDS
ncbi:MAG: IRE (iron responsive element), partial [Planctomycetota bacterium]